MVRNEDIPTDLVADILSRLPVKSLMRFKCVEKSWYHLIGKPRFVARHLLCFKDNQNIKDVDHLHLLIRRTRPGPHQVIKAFVSLLSFNQVTNHTSLNLLQLPYDPTEIVDGTSIHVSGPCNGIYFLYDLTMLLINPSMREVKVLPEYPTRTCIGNFPGLGFDPKANDYKVVFVRQLFCDYTRKSVGWIADLYSLRSNSWRQVDCPAFTFLISEQSLIGNYVHGACHWGGDDDVGDLILAFDMSDEMFRKIRGPALGISSDETRWSVASFKESLSVITYPRKGIDKYFDLWVMEDYGNEESWTKQIRIGPILGMQRPLGFWRNHQWILETTNGRMILYDPDVEEIKNLVVRREGYSFQAAIYMESLVSLKGENEENQAGISFLDIVPDSPLFDSSS